ncbi:hypothetical protein GCM10008024_06400 [Allgaiera indica]|uniref:Uncharacterized protein n=1 Tax=Allgaiera indica TaxID=765699 RepID=A0AAN4UNY5_9RHOB|nr:hypothetical protein GCM10008024_06400 [Allgaiera indica]
MNPAAGPGWLGAGWVRRARGEIGHCEGNVAALDFARLTPTCGDLGDEATPTAEQAAAEDEYGE